MQLNLTKNFIFFLISNTISSLGDYIYDIAIIVYLYQETGSSLVLGSFFIFQFVPTLIFIWIILIICSIFIAISNHGKEEIR